MNRIKQLRREKGIKQEELARFLNVQRASISKYETGRVPLTDETLSKLSKIFEVSTDYIIGLTDNPAPQGQLPPKPTIEDIILSDRTLSEESRKDLLKQYELLKLRDDLKKMNEEAAQELRPGLT